MHGPEQEGGAPDPVGQRRAVEADALAGEDLRLSIERQVVGVFGDEHLRDESVGRQAALDQPRRCRGLHDCVPAGAAGVARAADHQHAYFSRHHVEALGDVLTDPVQGTRAARTGGAVDIDEVLDPRQVGGQRPTVRAPLDPPASLAGSVSPRRQSPRPRPARPPPPEQELILRQALGAAAEAVALHRQDDLAQPLVLGALLGEQRLERLGIVGRGRSRRGHEADESRSASDLPLR